MGNTAVAVQEKNPFKAALVSATPQITNVLPDYLNPERMIQLAVMSVHKNPYLQKCQPMSIVAAVIEAAAAGLEPGGPLKQGDIVPAWNKKLNTYEAQFRPRYGGLMQLARNTGRVVFQPPQVVYSADEFAYTLGDNPSLHHKPAPQVAPPKDDDIIAAYSVAVILPDKVTTFMVMYRWEIEKARASSEMEKLRKESKVGPTPWENWYGEMCKKTVIKRFCKTLPMGNDDAARRLAEAIASDDREYQVAPEPQLMEPKRPLFAASEEIADAEIIYPQGEDAGDGALFDNTPNAAVKEPRKSK